MAFIKKYNVEVFIKRLTKFKKSSLFKKMSSIIWGALKVINFAFIAFVTVVVFLLLKTGGISQFGKSFEEYYLRTLNIPSNNKITNTFTGDIHGFDKKSLIVLARGRDAFDYESGEIDAFSDNSKIFICDETFPGLWQLILPQLGGIKEPTFKFLPSMESVYEDNKNALKDNSFDAYKLKMIDFDHNNTKEVLTFWIDMAGGSASINHIMMIYWNGKYRVAGLPSIPILEKKDRKYFKKIERPVIEVKNYYDQTVNRFQGFYSDDIIYFYDVDIDNHVELIRGLMIWGEAEDHYDAHRYLFEVFKWNHDEWEPVRFSNNFYFVSRRIDLFHEDMRKYIENTLSKRCNYYSIY